MDYQPRQQLANALDLSSRLAQKEQTKQQQQQRQSSLVNALCDTQDNRTNEHDNDGDEDWRRYLVRGEGHGAGGCDSIQKSNADIPLNDPLFGSGRGQHSSQQYGQQQGSGYWHEGGSKWSTRTSTSGCISTQSSDIPFSDIPEIAWDCSSLSTCSDLFPLVDCSYSITTNPDFDTHSELGYKHNKMKMMNPKSKYASSDISSTQVGAGSVRTSNSLPFTTYRRVGDEKLKHPQRHRTLTYSADSTQCAIQAPPIIHELQPFNPNNDFDRRRGVIEQMMQTVDLNGQLDIIRIIDPSVDIEQLKKAIIKIPLHQPIDDFKFNKIKDYVAQQQGCNKAASNSSLNQSFNSSTSPKQQNQQQQQPEKTHSTSSTKNTANNNSNNQGNNNGGLRRSNSDPNLVEMVNTQKAAADRRKYDRDMVIRQRRIFRWLNSQKSQTARRIRQLERERRRPDLFQAQEVVEVQKDETIDEQGEEIDVMGI